MRSYWLAIKIAAVFLFVMGTFVVITLHLFASTMMRARDHGHFDPDVAHHTFVVSVLKIGLVAMVLMIAFAIYVTAPLRRMSRSMDRIAAGDLEHRVAVSGNDEGAAMGRSFNTMAERVRGMVVGQKELMAGVSHELRSPLTRMKVSLALLREGRTGAGRIQGLEADVDELDSMVEELLLASRLDLGSTPISREELDLADVCAEAWNRVADRAQALGMTLDLECSDESARITANPALAVRLLGNLFENAVHHAGAGTVTVMARREGERVRINVSDEGPGVSADDLDRLFEPFFRADRSRSRRTGAGGLGLMIVQRAVEAHDGRVHVRAAEPHGLVVSFDLPA